MSDEWIQVKAFISEHSQNTSRVKQQQTGMTWVGHKSNPRAIMSL